MERMVAITVVGPGVCGRPTDATGLTSEPHPRVTIYAEPMTGGRMPASGD
jgi:hypothetical protein